MLDDFVIIDADRHLMEPDDLWAGRLDVKYQERAPFLVADFSSTIMVDGVQNNAGASYSGLTKADFHKRRLARQGARTLWNDIHWRSVYYDAILDNFGPRSYITDLDRENIDV